MPPPKQRRIPHEQRIFYYALLSGVPALIVAGSLLYVGDLVFSWSSSGSALLSHCENK
jgi:hypothetical protein